MLSATDSVMGAPALLIEVQIFEATEKLLHQWGDETRAHAERLGYPTSSAIWRMIQQQRVFPRRGVKAPRVRRATTTRERDLGTAQQCPQGHVFIGDHCTRCSGAERVTGRETRSLRPAALAEFSAQTLAIEAVVVDAPEWMQKGLRRRFQFKQPDSGAAQDLRMRKTRYREDVKAAVEYVANMLAVRRSLRCASREQRVLPNERRGS